MLREINKVNRMINIRAYQLCNQITFLRYVHHSKQYWIWARSNHARFTLIYYKYAFGFSLFRSYNYVNSLDTVCVTSRAQFIAEFNRYLARMATWLLASYFYSYNYLTLLILFNLHLKPFFLVSFLLPYWDIYLYTLSCFNSNELWHLKFVKWILPISLWYKFAKSTYFFIFK